MSARRARIVPLTNTDHVALVEPASQPSAGDPMSDVTFEFTMRATGYDRSGYYYPNWDNAEHLTVRAATMHEAINKGAAMLGRHPRHGTWTFKVDEVTEVPECACQDGRAAR